MPGNATVWAMRFFARSPLLLLLLIAGIAFPSAVLHAQSAPGPAESRGTPYFPPANPVTALKAAAPAAVLAAQSATTSAPSATSSAFADTPGLASCFDYYKFNSVPVAISADLSSAVAGAPLGVHLTVTNQNPYPIVDATVYVKVMRYGYALGAKNVNGPDVVDFFPATDPFTLPAGGSVNLSSVWQVPQDAEAGDYTMAAYVVSADRFELEGLSFTDDVVGGALSFKVVSDAKGSVYFDKDTATVLGQPFRFAAYPPRIPTGTAEVPVGIDLANTTPLPATEEVTWTLYNWDALRADQVLDQKTETVTVPAGGSAQVTYTVTDKNHSVYYLLGSVRTAGGSSSLVGIRFVRGDVNEPRLNFVGVTGYPAGAGSAAVACVHSAGTSSAENTELEIVATRPSLFGIGGTIARESYQGPATGDIRALVAPFTAAAGSFSVTARLFQNGALVDQVTEDYNCKDLSPDSCPESSVPLVPLVGAVVLLVILAVMFVLIRRRKSSAADFIPPPAPPAL